VRKVWHADAIQDPSYDTYVEAIVDELLHLSTMFHPIFVEANPN